MDTSVADLSALTVIGAAPFFIVSQQLKVFLFPYKYIYIITFEAAAKV